MEFDFQKVLYFENFEKGLIHTQNLRKIQENIQKDGLVH